MRCPLQFVHDWFVTREWYDDYYDDDSYHRDDKDKFL